MGSKVVSQLRGGQVGEESKKQMSGKVEDEWSREEEDELVTHPFFNLQGARDPGL